jgi:hypothetical protein
VFPQKDEALDTMRIVWEKRGNQGNRWVQQQVFLTEADLKPQPPGLANVRLYLDATVGSSDYGDIAVDDLKMALGECPHLEGKQGNSIKMTNLKNGYNFTH